MTEIFQKGEFFSTINHYKICNIKCYYPLFRAVSIICHQGFVVLSFEQTKNVNKESVVQLKYRYFLLSHICMVNYGQKIETRK